MTNRYDIFLLNQSMQPIAQIDEFKRAEIVKRFNDLGTLVIDMDYSVFDIDDFSWLGGWRVLRNGSIFSEGVWVATQDDDQDDPDSAALVLNGQDYFYWLGKRLVVTDPAGPPYSTYSHDVRTGPAANVIKAYARYHFGTLAKTARQISGLTIAADLGEGSTVTGRGRFDTMLEMMQDLALKGGDFGFGFDGTEFITYIPNDKTSTVIFSRQLGSLISYRRRIERPEANYIIAGGGGEGTSRLFQESSNTSSISEYGRIEWFYDYRNAADATELYSALQGKLEEFSEKVSIEIQVQNTEGINYGVDYDLGDKVTVVLPNLTYQNVIREVRVVLDRAGEHVYPVIGSPGARALRLLNKQFVSQRALQQRIGIVERI